MERTQYAEALAAIRHDVLEMGVRVGENVKAAIEALKALDVEKAKAAKRDDELVNALQLKIEDETVRVIATQAPVGRDLRMLVTVFKVTSDLERIGDYASHLAKAAKRQAKDPWGRPLDRLERMAETGMLMVRQSVDAFLGADADLAVKTAALDDLVDEEHKAFVAETIEYLRERPDRVEQGRKLMNTSSYLERMGDHVTNICESIIFMVEGKHVELND